MKWTVGTKIGAGFGLALAILIIIGGVSYRSTNKLTDTAAMVTHTQLVIENLKDIIQDLVDAEDGQRGFIITADESYLAPYQSGISTVMAHLKTVRDLTVDNSKQQSRMDLLEPAVKERLARLSEGIETQRSKGSEAAHQWVITGKGKDQMDDLRKLVGDMEAEETALLKTRTDEASASAIGTKVTILAGTGLAFVILFLAALLITRNIAVPLKGITLTAERIATGDLSVNVVADGREDEVGVLARTFSRMTQSLRSMAEVAEKIAEGDLRIKVKPQSEKDMLGTAFASMVDNLQRLTVQISEGVNVLSASSNEISTSTTQLASSASETATAVAETTTTVEEVRQTAQVASQKSKIVSESAQKVAQTAQAGRQSTEETIDGMQRIRQQTASIAESMVRLSEQTQAIGQIIASVDDLSAQSNLLAVNAAIEAGKAGEHGKGFAVVAQEVRNLAEQSKQATNQVRSILSDIQKATGAAVMATEQGNKAVEIGVRQSGEAGKSIQALSGSVTEAAQAATQIAASSQQQLVGLDQVASAIESIKQASSQNVTSARQLEAAAHNLKEVGAGLKRLVEHYKV